MNYAQAMKWQRQHPKGTRQPVLMSAGPRKFWPSRQWLQETWWPYLEMCKATGADPIEAEKYYRMSDAAKAEHHRKLSSPEA